MTQLYFAYGSNMSTARLAERMEDPRPLGAARLDDHRLTFDKLATDGSGKANIRSALGSVVHGVLYRIAASELELLDGFEPGYERTRFDVLDPSRETVSAWAYIHRTNTPDLVPHAWYVEHLLIGAREHRLPDRLICRFEDLLARLG